MLQVCEFFQDFDPLRSGSITKPQFQRGLSDLGLSALGQHRLTEAQLKTLMAHYQNPTAQDKVLWTRFMDDVESGGCSIHAWIQENNFPGLKKEILHHKVV